MQAEFWRKRWTNNQIGFHQPQVNDYLQQHWPALGVKQGDTVLVPLCGKSLDMLWLAGQGVRVLGVELSERAVVDFFREQGLTPQVQQEQRFKVFRGADIQIYCGDFFALTPQDVAGCTALYDRAALIALPPEMRRGYARQLQALLPVGSHGLLITLDYPQAQLDGPPFAVADDEVSMLFGAWQPQALVAQDILAQSPKFVQAGAGYLLERVYRLQR